MSGPIPSAVNNVVGGAVAGLGGAIEAIRIRAGSQLRQGIIGEEQLSIDELANDVDSGLFGAKSVSWRIHGDASMLAGGLRSLFLQTLHPLAMAGIAQHSDYRADPWGRLNRTSRFIGATTFGTTASAETAIAVVRSVHERVVGVANDGRRYAANDPHLLLWVHVAEIDSFLTCFERFGQGKLRDADRDRYVAEQAEIARRLGSERPPETASELTECLTAFQAECFATPEAYAAIQFLSAPPLPWYMRATYGSLVAGAAATLPTWALDELRLPIPDLADDVAFRPAARATTQMLRYFMTAPGR